jgi:hypothetical protein
MTQNVHQEWMEHTICAMAKQWWQNQMTFIKEWMIFITLKSLIHGEVMFLHLLSSPFTSSNNIYIYTSKYFTQLYLFIDIKEFTL